MLTTAAITYVTDSYQVYGNNGLSACYNSAINSSDCGITGSQFSFAVRNALHNFSDHLPVTLLLETDASLLGINDSEISNLFYLENTLIINKLELYIASFDLKHKDLIIYNSIGQIVKTLRTNADYRQDFDVSGLSNGIYYIGVNTAAIKPLKFIISN